MARRKILVHVLAIVLIVLVALAYHGLVPAKRAEIGMTLHVRGADAVSVQQQFDLMAAMNVKWVRIDIDWSVVESDRGKFDWAQTDLLVNEAIARQMNVLVVLAFSPEWARAATTSDAAHPRHYRPDNLSHYASFARAAAERYKPRGVHSWEIWNEPNTDKFWPPRPDADEYAALFRVAAAAIRSVDPEATLLISGLGPDYEAPGVEVPPINYLEHLYANGAAQLADAIAAHPYSFPAMPIEANQRTLGEFKDLPALHAVMHKHGDGHKKIWITEFGAPTGTDPNAASEECQAAALLQARLQVERWDWIGPLIYYELVDGGTDASDKEQNFGVLREDLTPKMAGLALMDTASS